MNLSTKKLKNKSGKRLAFCMLISLAIFCSCNLSARKESSFKVMFYNVENLFDCEHDSLKNDEEFLPSAARGWNFERYEKKLNDISEVIIAVGEGELPALVGLCEVENDKVLNDLTQTSLLKPYGYSYAMTDSPDERGIDVALLYQSDKFRLIQQNAVTVNLPEGVRPTRDILHVSGVVSTSDTVDVFVVHFPSRSGGEKETEPNRLKAASTLKEYVDNLMAVRAEPRIMIMGDFNDYPNNKAITDVMKAAIPGNTTEPNELYHLLKRKSKEEGYGSYKYRGSWGLLDHFIVSGNLLNRQSDFYTTEDNADVVRLPFLLEDDNRYGGTIPFRTYAGTKYLGGYSDHLPLLIKFNIRGNRN